LRVKVRLTKPCTPFKGKAIPEGAIVETWVEGGILQVKGMWLPLRPDEWEIVDEMEEEG
jgi:hypothetical protein